MTATGRDDRGPGVCVRLLDGFQLWVADRCVPVMPSSQRLLAYLALRDGAVTRAAVAAALWPEATERRAAACLRSALWRLVKPPYALIEVRGALLGLHPQVDTDVDQVRRLATGLADPRAHRTDPALPLAALTAELLPGWTEPWVGIERDWVRQMSLRVLETLSARFRSSGDHFRAHETAAAAVRSDPLRESAHRRLIELHLADGNPAQAIRQYATYRSLLRRELGLSPSSEIRQLVRPILSRTGSAPAGAD
ncbi:MAG: BTAD domain-containing putative transcriptional regulator [Labedaea sp.]